MDNKTYTEKKTNFAALNDTLGIDTRELNTCLITFTGTYNFTGNFEASDDGGTTWYPVQATQVNSNTVATSHATANATQAYELSCHAFTNVRVRANPFTSAGTHTVRITGTSMAVEPTPVASLAAGTAVSATVTALPNGTAHTLTSAATTNATSIKATAGNVFEIAIDNMSAAPKFVKLYNKASAPTVGTDVPILTLEVAANSSRSLEFGNLGKRFATGIAMAITGAQAVADTTAVAAGDVHTSLTYI